MKILDHGLPYEGLTLEITPAPKPLIYKIDIQTKWELIDKITDILAEECQTLDPDFSQDIEVQLSEWLDGIMGDKTSDLKAEQ